MIAQVSLPAGTHVEFIDHVDGERVTGVVVVEFGPFVWVDTPSGRRAVPHGAARPVRRLELAR